MTALYNRLAEIPPFEKIYRTYKYNQNRYVKSDGQPQTSDLNGIDCSNDPHRKCDVGEPFSDSIWYRIKSLS